MADLTKQELLRLESQVTGPWVEELRRVCAETLGNHGHDGNHLVLDLAGVSFLDADASPSFANWPPAGFRSRTVQRSSRSN